MSIKKLNDLEMSNIQGGKQAKQIACSATCTCLVGQTDARHAYAEHMLAYDSKFQ